ncbi:MAG: bile acid:sodium symporter family protein [Deltaproteobacteria bacterium]|nr:bile acid:sodium symporter family protein [Deltaproteobacteria bacterium]
MTRKIIEVFPVWLALVTLASFYVPEAFIPMKPAIVPLLGVIMFGMGTTLTAESFMDVVRRPSAVALGVAMQFALMPFFAWVVWKVLDLPLEVATGLVLVGCCPGGTASNVMTYLAKGDVALSITLTAVSTVVAVVLTPLLTDFYIGRQVPVPVGDMMLSIFKIVIVPVVAGAAVHRFLDKRRPQLLEAFPLVSVVALVLIIGIIVALNEPRIRTGGALVIAGVVLHNALGLTAGYAIPRALGLGEKRARTLAIEVGMQNSGLAVALSVQYFTALAALPGALFSVWHNVSGSLLAHLWARREIDEAEPQAASEG